MSNTVSVIGNHILVGLGGTGGKILRAFKMRMFEEFPTAEARKKQPVSILYVDSTDEMMPKNGRPRADFRVMGQDASFTNNEFLNIKAVDVEHILDHIGNYPNIKAIVDNVGAVKTAIGSLGHAAGQKRRAGRLLFAANAVGYVNSLRNAYARAEEISGSEDKTTIYIFAGLSGGTGSGSIIDAVVQTRKAYPRAKILLFAMMPEMHLPKADIDQGRYYQNGYAAMNELNALQTGRWKPQDVTGQGPADLYSLRIKGVANGLAIYSNVNENGLTINSLKELPKIVSDYVFARIFCINEEDAINEDMIRAFNFENMDDFPVEYDEAANIGPDGIKPVARTKKVNSFGLKRVIYPEIRILKHITYTLGEAVLYQFKFNNWRENQGYVNEERNKDYRREYFSKKNQQAWMLDMAHLTLDKKILESDSDYLNFKDYWHDKAVGYAEQAKETDNPLNELDNILADFFAKHFREDGVEAFYTSKERAIPEMAREVRRKIEHGLFEKWKLGDVSIVELQRVSKLFIERMGEIRTEIETAIKDEDDNCKAIDDDRVANVQEWSRLSILQRMVGAGARRFAKHQNILADYYISKTRLVALEFAKKLAARIFVEISKLDEDISAFAKKISDAIEETEKLVTAQRKVNKGLEDLRGAIIEVSEEKAMADFETDVKNDKIDMPNIARQLREAILPEGEFVNFGQLSNQIDIDRITDAFDIKLSEIVRTKHSEKADAEKKVLGLNILTQLQQQLTTDDDIKAFASKIVQQSGVYLSLNNDQIQLHLRNNEGILSPTNPASINKKVILVSIPSPDDNPGLKRFADKLEEAFKSSFSQGTATTNITINRKSPRKDELSIITVSYCYPLRAIDWLQTYRTRYENFLNTGNPNTDLCNRILLHSEGDGSYCPSLFAVDVDNIASATAAIPPAPAAVPPPMPGAVPPPMATEPEISLHIAVNGQQYGPFNREQCREMVKSRQLTPQSTVWMQGLPAWTPAEQVETLKPLFAPQTPADMPPMPLSMPPAL
ncbi:MAG: GYF domain-containing protein [Bacteroides sp.]|nr:GYF domain-containing protein [Bacteroides sp.]MCM1457991.1 GYF domain-containing protein [Lachnoclostridium sp.]